MLKQKQMTPEEMYIERLSYQRTSGYWKVAGKAFFDKSECLKYATLIKNYNITYHLFDAAFGSLDWTKDSRYSLDELYRRRAQQIRDKYNYVMLAFSGGADSINVLDTFLENNIPIDEVVCHFPLKAIEKLIPNFNIADKSNYNYVFEYPLAAAPKLKQVAKDYPNLKITVIDTTDLTSEIVLSNRVQELVKYGHSANVYSVGELKTAHMLREYQNKFGSACCVYGIDKPAIMFDPIKKKIGFFQGDFAHNKCKFVFDGYRPCAEPFYTTPDMPEIALAQIRIIAKALLPMLTSEHRSIQLQSMIEKTPFGFERIDEHTDLIKSLIYKNYKPGLWQVGKTVINLQMNDYDGWFHSTDLFDKRTKDYYFGQHTEWLYGIDPCLYKLDSEGNRLMFKPFHSRIFWT